MLDARSVNRVGPGFSPFIYSTPMAIAVMVSPGMPNSSEGTQPEASEALFEAPASTSPLSTAPIPPRMCGPCPQPDGTGHTCSTRLMAAPHETTVHCPACGTVHEVAELIRKLMDDVDWYPLSVQELSLALAAIGQPVPVKTIYRWTYEARLQSCGTKNGKPLYRLSDARQLSSERKRKVG